MPDHHTLTVGLEALGLDAALAEPLLRYRDELVKWNQAYNLTAVRDPAQMISRHLLDSLALVPWLDARSLIDVGSGAGLPGIPVAIARPDLQVVLLDSAVKRCRFCEHAVLTLGLDQVSVAHSRAEDYSAPHASATVASRAFASLADFVASAGHLAGAGGRLLAMKAARPDEEIAALGGDRIRGWRVARVHDLDVPMLDEPRCAVEIVRTDT